MKDLIQSQRNLGRMLAVFGFATLLMLSLWGIIVSTASADGPFPPPGAGYLDFPYGSLVHADPTAQKPESKLWWHDGFWWGSLYNTAADEYRIYRLNWGTQTWEDTGVAIDDREEARADALWDETDNKLYVVSHIAMDNSSEVNDPANWGRLYRYSYDETTQTYSRDSGFPVTVNHDKTEALVLAKDSTGRLWVTYVSRPQGTSDYQVYANASAGGSLNDDDNWGTPFTLTLTSGITTPVHVDQDDLASIIAFKDNLGHDKIGVMWSNQLASTLDFAYRSDGDSVGASWTHQSVPVPGGGDDHINIKSLQVGANGVYAAVKTNALNPADPLIGLVTRDPGGTLAFHTYSTKTDNDTRPILLLDEDANLAYIFVVGKPGGSLICYKSLAITSPPSAMGDFPAGNCGTSFIEDSSIDLINNPTSTKQNVNSTTGLVVLASDQDDGAVYVHNVLGNPPPVVTARGPARDATNVQVSAVVTATFSKAMNQSTLTTANFSVEDSGGPIAGNISYDSATRTATFTPDNLLKADTTYTVKLTKNIKDTSGKELNQGFDTGTIREQWSFTTGSATVQFSNTDYNVDEDGGTATITVTLNTPSGSSITVDYATSDGTATQGSDYTATSGTLTFAPNDTSQTFSVPITDDVGVELDETVNLTLSSPSNATLGVPGNATLTILDNEGTPTVQYSSSSFSVNEGDGSATIQVTLSHPDLVDPITVEYTTGDGTATAGSDYTTESGTLTFAPGETSQTFPVPILDDTLDEGNETVSLTLSNPSSNATLGTRASATLTILDDDPPPSVQFSSSAYSVNENGTTVTITATLSAPSGKPITVDYSASGGTATPGSDYTATNGTLAFAPGETSQTFPVPILDDVLDEGGEIVNLALSNPSNATLGAPDSAALTIVDDDPPPSVQFASSAYSVNEIAGTATITVTLSVVSGQSVSVDYATSDGTATAGDDYVATSDTLTFAPGEVSKAFTVTILNDARADNNETVNLTLSDPDDATLGTPDSATLTIVDDEKVIYLPIILRE